MGELWDILSCRARERFMGYYVTCGPPGCVSVYCCNCWWGTGIEFQGRSGARCGQCCARNQVTMESQTAQGRREVSGRTSIVTMDVAGKGTGENPGKSTVTIQEAKIEVELGELGVGWGHAEEVRTQSGGPSQLKRLEGLRPPMLKVDSYTLKGKGASGAKGAKLCRGLLPVRGRTKTPKAAAHGCTPSSRRARNSDVEVGVLISPVTT